MDFCCLSEDLFSWCVYYTQPTFSLVKSDIEALLCTEFKDVGKSTCYLLKSLENPIPAAHETTKHPGSPEHMRLLCDSGLIGLALSGP